MITRAWEGGSKIHRATQKMAAWTSISHICTRGLHSFRSFSHWRAASTVILCCRRPPSHHPSSLTSVSLVPALHLLLPSKPFWPNDTRPFFQHAQTISILSDLLYSLTPFVFQLSYAPLHFSTLSIRDTPTKLIRHFISRTFIFLHSALLIPHASALSVGTITPSYRHCLAFIHNSLLLSTMYSAPHAVYPSFILCFTSLSHPSSAANCDSMYLIQSTSSNDSPFSITCIRPRFSYLDHLIT